MNNTSELGMYVIRRRSGWSSPEELQAAAGRSKAVGDEEMSADIRWIRSYVVVEADGRLGTVSIYQASSPEKIREHAARSEKRGVSSPKLLVAQRLVPNAGPPTAPPAQTIVRANFTPWPPI